MTVSPKILILFAVLMTFMTIMLTANAGPQYRIKPSCLNAEDTAAHLKLKSYSDDMVIYGCYTRGY